MTVIEMIENADSMPTREPINKTAKIENKDLYRGNWNKRRPNKAPSARRVGKRVHARVAAKQSELDNILAVETAEFIEAYALEESAEA